ncbi:MAG: helix-turn-helix transcriptional regulator [Ruminiclostridium sp.]
MVLIKGRCPANNYTEPEFNGHSDPANCAAEKNVHLANYNVFPGIDVIYNDIHTSFFRTDNSFCGKNVIHIDHCRNGRLECKLKNKYFFLSAGDILIHNFGNDYREDVFPTGQFQGVTIQINIDNAPECLSELLEDVYVKPMEIVEKFRIKQNRYYVLRQMPAIEHIFSEMYSVPPSVIKAYLKIKVLELFVFLNSIQPEKSASEQRCVSEKQVSLAKLIFDYLTDDTSKNITVTELSEHFGTSAYQLNKCFQSVYGMSISGYSRNMKIREAARLLQHTDQTILEIAGRVGYENGSKFANVFHRIMGVTPHQYRNNAVKKIDFRL